MSEPNLEDLMLESAQEYFVSTLKMIEQTDNKALTLNDVLNQMYCINSEILKDILLASNLHLECYRCHETLLIKNQEKLNNKYSKAIAEYNESQGLSQSSELTTSAIRYEQAEKDLVYIEGQLIKYKSGLESLKTSQETSKKELQRLCQISKLKDGEIRNLQQEVDKIRIKTRKSLAKSSSEKKTAISKDRMQPYPASSYSLGVSQKSTTLESSRGSHSHS
jgi:hypothetical protein